MHNYIASFISVGVKHCFKYHPGTVIYFLKGSYDAISSFLSLWSVTSCLCIDTIPEVAKTKVSKEIFFIKVKTRPRSPKTAHSNTPPHVYVTVPNSCVKTPPKCIRKERRRNYYSRCSVMYYALCSIVAAVSWRRCVSLWKRKHFLWASKRGHN